MAISADIGETLEKVVNDLVENGRYNSKSEVLREGIRLVQEREARLRDLDAKLAEGLAQADAGLLIPAEEVFAQLRQIVHRRGASTQGRICRRVAEGRIDLGHLTVRQTRGRTRPVKRIDPPLHP